MRIIITGGAGFIGSNLIRYLIDQPETSILNIDKLAFPGTYETIRNFESLPESCYRFIKTDITNTGEMQHIFSDFRPDAIMHLAAESHVDRSIDAPENFIQSNIVGTYSLLVAAKHYFDSLGKGQSFRFHHISTDEVFGSLPANAPGFNEESPYAPNSPYSASKAAADHLVRAWHHTYQLPVVMSNCSNNYGPWQYPEKLIPLLTTRALHGGSLPIYGDGSNIRDWLYVEDHVTALYTILRVGKDGESYNVGGQCEKSNIEVVKSICRILDKLLPDSGHCPHQDLISFVEDRPGHDKRYAMDTRKITTTLGWEPAHNFETGLETTVRWYIDNQEWCRHVTEGIYQGERLGLG